jgi:hypothetical protein
MPDKAELPLKLVLPRAVIERLMMRAKREDYHKPGRVADGPAGAGGDALACHPEHGDLRVHSAPSVPAPPPA